MGPNA